MDIRTMPAGREVLTVYLAGSIDDHDSEEAFTTWRKYATAVLEAAGFRVLDPFRGRCLRGDDTDDIVGRNDCDIRRSDIILCETNFPGHAYIGTGIDLFKAWQQGKPVILWGLANRNSHYLKKYGTQWLDTLEEALEFLIAKKAALEAKLGEGE